VSTSQITKEELQKPEIPVFEDPEALSWPWLPGQVCWTEPTALAVLALESLVHTPVAIARLNEAVHYFQHFRTPVGGWDIGNAGPLDTIVLPRAHPTALVLLALNRFAPQEIQVEDLDALRQDMAGDTSILAKASGLLALRTLGEGDEAAYSFLIEHQLSNGSWNDNPYFTAWAMMALRGEI
jgi:hypothetical protein